MQEDRQRRALREALNASFIGEGDVWAAYVGLGGTAGETEIAAYIHGLISLPKLEDDILAQAANGLIEALPPLPRATYTEGYRTGTLPEASTSPPE